MREMKIGFVNNCYQSGGAETVVQQLHFGCRRYHQSFLYIAEGKEYPGGVGIVALYPQWLSRLNHSRLHDLTERWAPRYAWTDRAFRNLAHSSVDLFHVHNFHGTYASIQSLAYLAARKPLIWTFHRFWGITGGCDHPGGCSGYLHRCGQCPRVHEWPICGLDNTAQQLRLKREHLAGAPIHIVAPSKHLARKIRESPVGRSWSVSRIANGVDTNRFAYHRKHDANFRVSLGLKRDAVIILIVNRDFRDSLKGFSMIEATVHEIYAKGLQFVLAGSNSGWAISRLPDRFSYVDKGYIDSRKRIAELYEAADIFLFASPRENFPCVILEAMSAKCCVVATPTDGVTEQIEDAVSGLISNSFSPSDLASALMVALSSQSRMCELGNAARRRVELEFSEQVMIDAHLKLYEWVAGRVCRREP
jgi:glycosyltransferase involved in cell wall biosynthesis